MTAPIASSASTAPTSRRGRTARRPAESVGDRTAREIESGPDHRLSWGGIAAAVVIAALGFLPIVNWIPNGYELPDYGSQVVGWVSGSAIAVGMGVVLAILSRRAGWLWRVRDVARVGALAVRAPVLATAAAALAGGCLYAAVALGIFHGRPLLIDEIVEVRQAQIFAHGHLWLPTPRYPEFFSSLHMVDAGGRTYSQFPPGAPAVLAIGALLGATWIIGPLCGVLSVLAFGVVARAAEPDVRVAVGATALFALAPFTVFMSGSHMNHVTALTCILAGVAALLRATATAPFRRERARRWLAFASGLGFGAAATIRPVDALAFAAPAGAWYLARALRDPRRWTDALVALAGVALPMGAMFYVNAHTTGAPLLFGYQVMWGKDHDLGFHPAPWGQPHTPARGAELINLYFLRLQDYLFETPIPALVPAIGALALGRRLRPPDRYLLVAGALVTALYFAYWADGNFLGPRFMFALGPLLALWTARFPVAVGDGLRRARLGAPVGAFVYRAVVYALVVSAAIAAGEGIPLRAHQYRNNFATERWATPRVAADAGVVDALVFVREGWEEQLVARLWALGVSHPHVETLYRAVDACRLDSAVTALERESIRAPDDGAAADPYDRLRPLLADSAQVETETVGPGAKIHVERGAHYTDQCERRVRETAAGISPLAPLLALGGPTDRNVYVRDLHDRDSLVVAAYPDRPIYLLRPTSAAPGALPAFYPVSKDSLARAWADEQP